LETYQINVCLSGPSYQFYFNTFKYLNWFLGYTTSVRTLCNFLSYYIIGCLGLKHLVYWYIVFPFFSNIWRLQTLWSVRDLFLISNFRHDLNVVFVLLGDSDAGESPKRKNIVLDLLLRNRRWLAAVILSPSFSLCLCVCVCVCVYIYIYIDRERDRRTDRQNYWG
jgi:hypothetical protein